MSARRKVSSGGPYEDLVGYSRAVAAGELVWVAGCASVGEGTVLHEGDMTAQTARCIEVVATALAELDCTLADVVRTTVYVTDISRWEQVAEAHRAAFGDIRPASTMVEVSALMDPRMLVEVEAVAHKPGSGW